MNQNEWYKNAFYRVSAVGVICNDKGEYLMAYEHGRWSFPGGGWDFGESLHEALKRELHEEISLTSDFSEELIAAIPFYNPNKDAWQMWIVCKILYENLEIGSDSKWMRAEEIDLTTAAGALVRQTLETGRV